MVVFDGCCPVCRSLRWGPEGSGDASSSYSWKKGVAGAALLGPVGAVAGIGGKKHKSYTWRCKECGYTKTYVD